MTGDRKPLEVTAAVIRREGRVLICQRPQGKNCAGLWEFPGGKIEPGEEAETCIVRECREEIGVEPEKIRYVASFPNSYEYKGILYKTCDLFFEAEIPEGAELKAQEGEVLAFEPMRAGSEDEIERIPLAFESARLALMENIGKGRKQ